MPLSSRQRAIPAALLATIAAPLAAQNAMPASWDPQQILRTEKFVKPPANIEKMIMAPRVDISFSNPSPDRKYFLRASGADRGDIKAYGASHIWLGGLQVDTKANRNRSVTTSTRTGLQLVDPHTGATRELQVPAGATLSAPVWSPKGTQIAFIANFPAASYAYVADVATGKSVRLSERPLLATLVTDLAWTGDGKSIVTVLVPTNRGAAPTHGEGDIEDGPQVRLTDSRAVPQPVHFSLLQDPHEKAQLTYYTTGQVALIDARTKAVKPIGSPTMVRDIDAAYDGAYVRVTRMTEPFSYLVPVTSFGSVQELWDASGKVVATLANNPLREGGRGGDDAPVFGAAPTGDSTGRRNFQWNPVGPGMIYLQSSAAPAAPSGDAANGANGAAPANGRGGRGGPGAGAPGGAGGAPVQVRAQRTRLVLWKAPYGAGDTSTIYAGGPQFTSAMYSTDSSTLFVSDSGSVIAVRVKNPSERFNLGRNVTLPATGGGFGGGGGRGGAGGADSTAGSLLARSVNGISYVMLSKDGKNVAVSGTRAPGANWYKSAPRPWVDRLDITSRARTRVMDSPADVYETFVSALNDDVSEFIVTRESPTMIPDAHLRAAGSTTAKQLTKNVDVGPEVSGAIQKRIQIVRPRDGSKFWADVLLPRDWKQGQKVPGIIWFYPREYSTTAEYDRSRWTTNINAFPTVPSARPASSMQLWVAAGYTLIQPDIPIYGDAGRMNDNYTRDLKEGLDATLNAVVDSGWVDRDKMGIGGHSYGAFSTVNALTLMPNFKAGIAGDGMYNRTLTPFGFQSERRSFYDAQATYLDMSPFLRANKISGALLMYHAIEDQNQGTDPISSKRMMAALQGLGKPAALYMYPYEDHSVATYASDLDLWARWIAWMDIYVKTGKTVAPVKAMQNQ